MEDWSVRDVVYHVAVWCEHGSEALGLAAHGRGDEFAYSTSDTDAMNARFLADGRSVSPADALAREEAAFGAFGRGSPGSTRRCSARRLGNGDTVEEVIVYDGPEHYASARLRCWFGRFGRHDRRRA